MKRSKLKRKTPLRSSSTPGDASAGLSRSKPLSREKVRLRRVNRQKGAHEPGRDVWKTPHFGHCENCGKPGRMIRHHVVYEQDVRRLGGDPWDLRDAMDLGLQRSGPFGVCDCHEQHHNASHRIRLTLIPDDAIDFAVQLMGVDRAALYLRRRYLGDDPRVDGDPPQQEGVL